PGFDRERWAGQLGLLLEHDLPRNDRDDGFEQSHARHGKGEWSSLVSALGYHQGADAQENQDVQLPPAKHRGQTRGELGRNGFGEHGQKSEGEAGSDSEESGAKGPLHGGSDPDRDGDDGSNRGEGEQPVEAGGLPRAGNR